MCAVAVCLADRFILAYVSGQMVIKCNYISSMMWKVWTSERKKDIPLHRMSSIQNEYNVWRKEKQRTKMFLCVSSFYFHFFFLLLDFLAFAYSTLRLSIKMTIKMWFKHPRKPNHIWARTYIICWLHWHTRNFENYSNFLNIF